MRGLFLFILLLVGAVIYAQPGTVDIGTGPDTGDGDPLRTAMQTLNTNDVAAFDSLAVHLDTLKDLRTDQNAIIALDEPERLTFFDPEAGIEPNDTMVVKSDGTVVKITKSSFQYDLVMEIGEANTKIAALEDSVIDIRAEFNAWKAATDYDSLVVNDDITLMYLYVPTPTGQVRATLDIDDRGDISPPTYISGEVGDYSDSVIVLTFSEYLLGDSIYDYSGAAGGNWAQMDYAANFDQPTGTLTDFIGGDNGTNYGAYQLDSAGVAGFGWYFDGTDYVAITGVNYGTGDAWGAMWVKIPNVSADGFFLGGADNGALTFGHLGNGLVLGEAGAGTLSTATTGITLSANVWTHVAFVRDYSEDNVTFYINGDSEVESLTYDFTLETTAIGTRKSGYDGYFTGMIDDLFTGNYAVVESTIDSIWNEGPPGRRYNDSGGSVAISADTIIEAFYANISPLLPGFAVDSVWILGNKIYLDLTDDATYGDIVNFNYTKPTGAGSNMGVRDTSDNYMATISFLQTVTNNVDTSGAGGEGYEIFEHWDFTGESLGAFDCTDLQNLFGTTTYYNCSYITTPEIVQQTINGVSKNVLKITNDEGLPDPVTGYYGGLNYAWDLDSSYDDIYVSYNIMIDPNVCFTPDIKLHGFNPGNVKIGGPMVPGDGFRAQGYLKYGGEFNSYFYVRNYRGGAWDGGTPSIDSVYMVPGVWYSLTMRVHLNDYDGTNGVWEAGINGGWKNQLLNMQYIEDYGYGNDVIAIKHWTGGWGSANRSDRDWHTYLSDITIWKPFNDDVFGTYALHDSGEPFDHPYEITDRDFYYESIISTEVTLTNDDWGSPYGSSTNEYHLLDAGAGNQVQIVMNSGGSLGSGDYLFVYDGNTSDATKLGKYNSQSIAEGITLQSSSRYMYIFFTSANYSGYGNGWSFDITH